MNAGIARIEDNKIFLGVDATKIADYRGASQVLHGRESVRLESKETWSSGIMIADVEHMPGTTCGVWPALWSYNNSEDPVGEIDLVEGINVQDSNVVDGCGSTMPLGSYGKGFNDGAGGIFAIWLLSDALNVYWWKRDAVPADVLAASPDPNTWGTPTAQFLSGDGCRIINTAFCGENIPQSVWEESCLASTGFQTCDDYVTQNPEAFADSYWLFNSIKVYDTVDA
ncbi:hypothetical protein NLG97_g2220 [Lecanicillium saksenae]|uniref:Uncharacterized protein n=1 Tax=Lecanicillium saksenae TaxID=468837 RepID=A0ACC1R1G2_9HYPO|nr:hypothetical protein NLG97_g2220 [Lecanicillium saksenae]